MRSVVVDTPASIDDDSYASLLSSDLGASNNSLASNIRPRGHPTVGQTHTHQDRLGSRALSQFSQYPHSPPLPRLPSPSPSPPPQSPSPSPPPPSPPSLSSQPSSSRSFPPSHPYQHHHPPPSPPLSFQPQPMFSEAVRNQQIRMTGYDVDQVSGQYYPGGPIHPGVLEPPTFQNTAIDSRFFMSGNYDPALVLSYTLGNGYRPPSFPSHVPGYCSPPFPTPPTSAGVRTGPSDASAPVSVLHVKVRSRWFIQNLQGCHLCYAGRLVHLWLWWWCLYSTARIRARGRSPFT